MNKKTKLTLSTLPAITSIPCFIKAHEKTVIEINNQLEKFGFYKEDIITLKNEYIIRNWLLSIGITLAVIGAILIFESLTDFIMGE